MRWFALLPAIVAIGCAPRDPNPFLGKWNGGFVVTEAGKEQVKELARNNLIGYLQVYGTEKRFELHLRGEQESITAKGQWTSKGDTLTLKVLDLSIDDAGGEQKRRMDQKYIPPDDLRTAYQAMLALALSPDKKQLIGQKTNVGALIGRHEFAKVTHRYTY